MNNKKGDRGTKSEVRSIIPNAMKEQIEAISKDSESSISHTVFLLLKESLAARAKNAASQS